MANLTVLQFKIYELQKKEELNKKDASFFINSIESLINHATTTLEQAIDNMYECYDDFSDFKEQLKCISVSVNDKFLFDYVDSFNPEYEEIIDAIHEIREELLEKDEIR